MKEIKMPSYSEFILEKMNKMVKFTMKDFLPWFENGLDQPFSKEAALDWIENYKEDELNMLYSMTINGKDLKGNDELIQIFKDLVDSHWDKPIRANLYSPGSIEAIVTINFKGYEIEIEGIDLNDPVVPISKILK